MLDFITDLPLLPTSPLKFLIFCALALLWKLISLQFISGDRVKSLNPVLIFEVLCGNPIRLLLLLTEFKPYQC